MDLERVTLRGLARASGPTLERCTCGHLRASHLELVPPPCWASMPATREVRYSHREPCPCLGYEPEDGSGDRTFEGQRMN